MAVSRPVTAANAQAGTPQELVRLVRGLSNALAAFLHSLPDDIWRDAERYPSGCEQWKLADVVTHLIYGALGSTMVVRRALRGELSPPMSYRPLSGADAVDHIVSLRQVFGEDLVPEFNATCKELNGLFVALSPEEYSARAWATDGTSSIGASVGNRIVELAIHGWDVRYAFDRAAPLSPQAMPFVADWVEHGLADRLRANNGPAGATTYRFVVEDSPEASRDLVVSAGALDITTPSELDADVTFRCDRDAYLLLLLGRLPFDRSVRRGRLSFDGDENLAKGFAGLFEPL